MEMSYRRAWELIDDLNTVFGRPVVEPKSGGAKGGGATLTTLGAALVARYREMEKTAVAATSANLKAMAREIGKV